VVNGFVGRRSADELRFVTMESLAYGRHDLGPPSTTIVAAAKLRKMGNGEA